MADPQVEAACQVALETWKILGCRDAGRVDMRFGIDREDSVPNVLGSVLSHPCRSRAAANIVQRCQVSPIAGLTAGGYSSLPACAAVNGISFEDLIAQIVDSATERTHNHELL